VASGGGQVHHQRSNKWGSSKCTKGTLPVHQEHQRKCWQQQMHQGPQTASCSIQQVCTHHMCSSHLWQEQQHRLHLQKEEVEGAVETTMEAEAMDEKEEEKELW
jgi:hypothetical protein